MQLKSIFLAILTFAIFSPAFAQNREKKMKEAIVALDSTEFVQKYKSYQDEVEKTVGDFKAISSDFSKEDVREVQYAYRTTRDNFNKIIETIKKDLLDKKNRNFMKGNPDRYTQFVASELELAYKNYQSTVAVKITQLTKDEDKLQFGLFEIKLMINLVFDVIGVINTIEDELSKMNDKYLEDNFISPLRVKEWEKL